MTAAPNQLQPDITLLPCPFCGGNPQMLNGGPGNWFIQCTGCKTSSNDVGHDRAAELWNTRSPPVAQRDAEPVANREKVARVLQGANAIGSLLRLTWDEVPANERDHWLFLADAIIPLFAAPPSRLDAHCASVERIIICALLNSGIGFDTGQTEKIASDILAALRSAPARCDADVVSVPFVCPRCGVRGTTDGKCSSIKGDVLPPAVPAGEEVRRVELDTRALAEGIIDAAFMCPPQSYKVKRENRELMIVILADKISAALSPSSNGKPATEN